ncbi:MAG: 4Fe-4S binding protein [Ruminococcaceae bacterium]|nr:4Fe-4S binding protein [Oscillospiraceae bacterium]
MRRLKQWLPTKRKLMQLYFGLLFNANLKGYLTGNIYKGNTKNVCVPGINCYSCPGAVGACPIGSLQGSFSSANRNTLYYVAGILLIYCVMFGRMICGWLCPFGLVQELLYKIKTPKIRKSPVTRVLSWLKYAILIFFVLIVPIMYAFRSTPLPAFCKYICPAGTLEGGLALLSNKANEGFFSMLGPLFTWKFLLMVSILVGAVFIFRLFCRFICPLGALYGLFNKLSFFGIQVDTSKCIHCGMCTNTCRLDIRYPGDQECISCGECVQACPTKAIRWKNWKPYSNEKRQSPYRLVIRIISAVLMVTILAGVVGYYWVTTPDPIIQNPDTGGELVVGNAVGNLCPGADLQIITGNGIQSETVDPSKTGKITIINFWGTWCSGCILELPYFDQIASDYQDTVAVIAVHTNSLADTAPTYISEHYPNSKLIFVKDNGQLPNEEYYLALGGRGAYPYTIVLDENGIITEIFFSSVHYEDLKNAIENIG